MKNEIIEDLKECVRGTVEVFIAALPLALIVSLSFLVILMTWVMKMEGII